MPKDWFKWNGTLCTEYGIRVSDQPPITQPVERVTYTDVPGRSGSLRTKQDSVYPVFDDISLTAKCVMKNEDSIDAIKGWLKGTGSVVFANRSEGHYNAVISNQIPFEQVMRGRANRSFSVIFRCEPYMYLDNVQDITVTASGTAVTNPYNIDSKPVITVYGSGDITIHVGSETIYLYSVASSVTLDAELEEAYSGNEIMSGSVDMEDWNALRLPPGISLISWAGSVSRIVISPNWRKL